MRVFYTEKEKTVFLVLPSWAHPSRPFQPVECFSVGPVSHSSLWVPFTRDWESHDRPAGTSSPPSHTHTRSNKKSSAETPLANQPVTHMKGGFWTCACVLVLPVLAWFLVLPGRGAAGVRSVSFRTSETRKMYTGVKIIWWFCSCILNTFVCQKKLLNSFYISVCKENSLERQQSRVKSFRKTAILILWVVVGGSSYLRQT